MKTMRIMTVLVLLGLLVSVGGALLAQSPGYTLVQWTTSSSGDVNAGNQYSVRSVVGAPLGRTTAAGATYALRGGFGLPGESSIQGQLYLPVIEN